MREQTKNEENERTKTIMILSLPLAFLLFFFFFFFFLFFFVDALEALVFYKAFSCQSGTHCTPNQPKVCCVCVHFFLSFSFSLTGRTTTSCAVHNASPNLSFFFFFRRRRLCFCLARERGDQCEVWARRAPWRAWPAACRCMRAHRRHCTCPPPRAPSLRAALWNVFLYCVSVAASSGGGRRAGGLRRAGRWRARGSSHGACAVPIVWAWPRTPDAVGRRRAGKARQAVIYAR